MPSLKDMRKISVVRFIIHPRHWTRALQPRDIAHWMQQLSRLMHTGLSLIQALHILASCQTHPKMLAMMHNIQCDLESGSSFAEALQKHPSCFDSLVCALINLGERSGNVSAMIAQIAVTQSKNIALKQQLKTLLIYPITVLGITSIVTVYLLLTVVPQLQSLFQHVQAPLPWATLCLLALAAWIKTYGLLALGISCLSIVYIRTAYRHFPTLRHLRDKWLLHLPGIGPLYRALYMTRSFHALAIASQASLPLPDALQWIALIAGNTYYKRAFLHIRSALQQGESMRSAVMQTRLFPELVIQMLGLGEESGTLPTLLADLAHYYAQTIEQTIQHLARYIEPILMIVLGLLIGGLILSMYLPMIQLGALL